MAKAKRKRTKTVTLPALPTGMIPTEHTMARSRYELMRIEQRGPKVAVNAHQSPLRAMEARGTLTAAQREAGEVYEALYRMIWGGSRADILALVVRGIAHETEAQADRIIKARRLMSEINRSISHAAANILRDVCVSHLFIGENNNANRENYTNIRDGLDACIKVFGIPAT